MEAWKGNVAGSLSPGGQEEAKLTFPRRSSCSRLVGREELPEGDGMF